ncbi:hypothetical protein CDAR_72171 [Caerostris darwini]|uniref:Uncharacterized protein n=1 Tax=Caerostris darwini TaxID=1538125 RepID=A0AAV4MKM3_9ARAC|nr:hypothetical protein CDAR_72171 [Caerostris darwini]
MSHRWVQGNGITAPPLLGRPSSLRVIWRCACMHCHIRHRVLFGSEKQESTRYARCLPYHWAVCLLSTIIGFCLMPGRHFHLINTLLNWYKFN